jgi:hypothetical protein
MGARGYSVSVVCLTIVLAAASAGGAPGVARSQAVALPAPVSTAVSAFFVKPRYRSATPALLSTLTVESVTRNEQVTSACFDCATTTFRTTSRSFRLKQLTLRASSPLRMRVSTRIIVGVTAPGEMGRWIVFGFTGHQYVGENRGCMSATVTALVPAAAKDPRTIPETHCQKASPKGTESVFFNGVDHQLYEQQYSRQLKQWQDRLAIGSGAVSTAPAVVVQPGGEQDVFWKDPRGSLWMMSYTGYWNPATNLGKAGMPHSGPSALIDANGVTQIFWRGTDGWLWHMSDNGGVLSAVSPVTSGPVASAPAIVAVADGTVDLFWLGKDRKLWRMHYRDPSSGNARAVPGANKLGSAPAALLDPDGVEHVYWRGTDGLLWEIKNPWSDTSTSFRAENSGTLGSAPAVVTHPSGVRDVFWRGTGGGLREAVWFDDSWSTQLLPGTVKVGSRPAVALSP